jgi:hypothetical protein
VGPRAVLEAVVKKKILSPGQNNSLDTQQVYLHMLASFLIVLRIYFENFKLMFVGRYFECKKSKDVPSG